MKLQIELPDDLTPEEVEAFRVAWAETVGADPNDGRRVSEVLDDAGAPAGLVWDRTSSPVAPRFIRKAAR